jgi:hypothetical protein
MKANPGGQIDTRAVVGRDRLIAGLWDTISVQSLIITAERRIGKTTVIKKMRDEPRPGWAPVYQDLERCHTAAEFAMAVYQEVDRFLSRKGRLARRAKEFLQALGGTEIGGLIKMPESAQPEWKDVLSKAIEDLMHEGEPADTKLLFLWDEVPFMLANIRDREGEQTAMEVLDLLRALRQMHDGLRMIVTGSVGLHHVLTSLKEKGYANAPVNDMASIDVPPLSEDDAVTLALRLVEGENLHSMNPREAAEAIAREADAFPFYIHHIVKALRVGEMAAEPSVVAALVSRQLVDASEPWELLHYRERMRTYYAGDEKTATLILDHLATAEAEVPINVLLSVLKGVSSFDDRERLLRLLNLMERDHYVARNDEGHYRFRFGLIRRWWKVNRGL